MVALGDSITLAYGACLAPADCPRNSWSTGNGTSVNSHYKRILAENPAIKGHATNLAVSGATVSDLPGQAAAAVGTGAEYVTVLIGANDACHNGIDGMTSVANFRAKLDEAFDTLAKGLPNARVLVASIPNVNQLWSAGHTHRTISTLWSAGICLALLDNAESEAQADVDRRHRFQQRIGEYNSQLAAACRRYGRKCRSDGGAVYDAKFSLDDVVVIDFFHPNVNGQNKLAKVTFPSSFNW